MKSVLITGLFLTIGVCGFAQTRTQNAATTPIGATVAPKNGAYTVNATKQNAAKPNVAIVTKSSAHPTFYVNPAKSATTKQSPAGMRIEGNK